MEFEVGQRWKDYNGAVREIMAVGPEVVAYLYGRTHKMLRAVRHEVAAARAKHEQWELIHPKPAPEGWEEESCGTLRLTDLRGSRIGVRRRKFTGDGTQIVVMATEGGVWVDPESLKAAIDFVMEADN